MRHRCSLLILVAAACGQAMVFAQDRSPLADYHVWLPMTGVTPEQMDDAAAAGFNAVMFKVHPTLTADGRIEVDRHATLIAQARARGLKIVVAILGWQGLDRDQFWDTDEDGSRIPGRLDPFWPEAMERFEWYLGQCIEHYAADPDVVAFAPTWGIYGEAGFTSFTAGRSPHALDRFNEWLSAQGLSSLERLPTRHDGPNTDWSRFVRFRYVYMQDRFDAIVRRLKPKAAGRPVGMWQELYPVIGHLWTMVRVPSADFALYESCFPFQTSHDPQRTLAEAMGFRYRCRSASEFKDYYLPLLARKRGEGQRFMGCQLSDAYAVQQYGWSSDKAEKLQFDRWEDEFSPHLARLMAEPLESPQRDVLLVFPTYAGAALTDHPRHSVDVMSIDVLLRQYGCQMVRIGSPRLDELTVEEMNAFRLIVVPAAAYILPATCDRLRSTSATVLFTGCFGQSWDAQFVPWGASRELEGRQVRYFIRPPGRVDARADHPMMREVARDLARSPVNLPEGECFAWTDAEADAVLMTCGAAPLLSAGRAGKSLFLHGQFFADVCYDPQRKPPANLGGSADASANEIDLWGPYSSTHPQQTFAMKVMQAILDHAEVRYRVPAPEPRTLAPLLGDHLEVAGISANLAYNNTGTTRSLTVRLPWAPVGMSSTRQADGFLVQLSIPPFSYVALQPAGGDDPQE